MCPQDPTPTPQVLRRSSDERDSETNKQLLMALLNPDIVRPQHSLHLEHTPSSLPAAQHRSDRERFAKLRETLYFSSPFCSSCKMSSRLKTTSEYF